jgi:hypothetical protein
LLHFVVFVCPGTLPSENSSPASPFSLTWLGTSSKFSPWWILIGLVPFLARKQTFHSIFLPSRPTSAGVPIKEKIVGWL